MKAFVICLLFIFISLIGCCQIDSLHVDCDELLNKEVDKMTGNTSISSKENIAVFDDKSHGFIISIVGNNESAAIIMDVIGASDCVDKNSKINFLFTDGTRLELKNDNNFNCDGVVSVILGVLTGMVNELNVFRNNKISAIRAWTSSGYVQNDIPDEKAIKIMNTFSCLSEY
jgi:hypothetical protein